MTTTDPGVDYATDAEAERDLFGDPAPSQTADPAPATGAPPPAAGRPRKRAPGPPPNPNSGRQQKLARAAMRAKTAPAPAKKAKPNTTAGKEDPSEIYHRGAMAILGWPARGLAAMGLGMQVAANTGRMPEAKARRIGFHGEALALDSAAVQAYAEPLAAGAAELAPHVPWAANVLQNAAKLSPFAAFGEAVVGLVLQCLANHGVLPMGYGGTLTPPELMAAAGIELPEPAPGNAYVRVSTVEEPAETVG